MSEIVEARTPDEIQADLVELAATCYHDPERFVDIAYPWGEPGTFLEHHEGPDEWQRVFLRGIAEEVTANAFNGHDPAMPVQRAVSKGHGVGGSVMIAWLTDWIMVTRPHSQGVVTANTKDQLDTKTWATVRRWTRACLFGSWFTINTQKMYHVAFPESWFCSAQTCREENSEAFAGQHAADSSSFYMYDEDSNIPKIIHEVAEGGMTDGEPFQFRFGNATRNNGGFYEACFGKSQKYWKPTIVDSRTSRFSNKALIARWLEEHGEDSDFFRVRVRGLPPRASDLQFIDADRIRAAMTREPVTFDDDPLVVGVDFSGGGQAWNVIRFRRGLDARSIQPIRVPGEKTRGDRSAFLAILAEIMADRTPGRKVHAMFCDSAFGSPYVERLHSMGYLNVYEINFGETTNPDEKHCLNMRAYMWKQSKEWLLVAAIPDDPQLEAQAGGPGFHLNNRDQLVIESKKSMEERGVASPDDWDAIVLTLAVPVAPRKNANPKKKARQRFAGRGSADGAGLGWTH